MLVITRTAVFYHHKNSSAWIFTALYRAARFADFEGILGFSVPSIILVKAGLMQITM